MPGTLNHILFAETILQNSDISLDKKNFLSGNLIPDFAIDKSSSHFRKESFIKGIWVPDMEKVEEIFFDPSNSLKFGIYCHLYLDYHFIINYLIPNFIWDHKNMQIINKKNGITWEAYNFFSGNGLYRGYNEINTVINEKHLISLNTLKSIPEILPLTGNTILDNRKPESWLFNIMTYFINPMPYTGEIFVYEEFMEEINLIASQLLLKIKGKTF